MSLAEWVRQALDIARRQEPKSDVTKKIQTVRAAVRHEFPTGNIDEMLAEIESGYNAVTHP
jgi:hypothetical protein